MIPSCRSSFIFAAVAAMWLSTLQAQAQAPGTGAIAGHVFDPSGAALPSAKVILRDQFTQAPRSVVLTPEGFFRAPLLAPGLYSVVVEAPGFSRKEVRDVQVVVSETTGLDVTLGLGAVGIDVNVSDAASLPQTESSTLGRATDERTISSLPLANRNYTQILALSPGVLVELPNAADLGKNNQNVSANGAKTTANNFQFNGIDANNLAENSASGFAPQLGVAIPAPDSIAQFKVQTGNYDAGYGRGSGANVDVISRIGTNNLHGSIWEFLRNDALNANEFFLKRNGQRRPELKQNQFGFTLGGPIRKNKTFLFGSYQGTIQRDGGSSVSLQHSFLPLLGNDRSRAALGAAFCPANQPGNAGFQTFAGGVQVACDGSNINPVAVALLNFKFPNGQYAIPSPQTALPAVPGSLPVGESTFSSAARYREDQFGVNLDQVLSAANQLSGRFFYSQAPTVEPFTPFGANLLGWGTTEHDQNLMSVISDTHVFTPNVINIARIGFMRFDGSARISQPIRAADVGMATPSGLPETPGIFVNGLFTIGTGGEPFSFQNTNTFVWQDTVSLTRGRHDFRMGGEAKRIQLAINEPFIIDGDLIFLSFPDFLLGMSAAQNGSSMSNIFQSIGASGLFRKDERYSDFAGFFQDDWKVNPRLTVNAGLRYEYFGPPTETHGRLPDFNPDTAAHNVPASGSLSGFTLPANYHGPLPNGVTRTPYAGMWSSDRKDISPRFGFALRVLNRPALLLRGGYGIYYERLSGQLAEQSLGQPPFSLKQSLQGAENAGATWQQPYVPALPLNSSYPVFLPRVPGGAISLADIGPHLRSPYAQEYNLNVQQEFARDYLLEVGYVGSKTTHLAGCLQFNQALLATPAHPVAGLTTSTVENVVQRLPYAGIAEGSYICQTTFDSNYNALQTSLTKRFSHGLELLASHTFSKNLDFTSGTGGLSAFDLGFATNDQTKPRQSRGLNDFDRRQRFVLSATYNTPSFNNALLRKTLSRWQVSSVVVFQSGTPLTPIDSTAGSVYGNLAGFSRAQCTGANPASSGSVRSRLNGYYNLTAFAPPPVIGDGTGFGSCGVGILRGPGQRNADVALQREFPITEKGSLHFRTEFFNLTNTPNFGTPVNDYAAGAAFGVISSTVTNPRIIQFALKYQF